MMVQDAPIEILEPRPFRVLCMDLEGEVSERVVFASSEQSAFRAVRAEGLFPCGGANSATPAARKSASKPIRDAVLLRWLRALRGLTAVGTLGEQLERSSENVGDRRLKAAIRQMQARLREGTTHLEELMAECWRDFPAWIIGFVRIARTNAKLSAGIDRITVILARNEGARRARKLMMLQPRLLSVMLLALLVAIGLGLAPQLEAFAARHCATPPFYVQALFTVARLPANPVADIALVIGFLLARSALSWYKQTESGALVLDRLSKSLPGAGQLDRLDAESRIARGLAFFLEVDGSRGRALSMLIDAAPSPLYGQVLREIYDYYTSQGLTRLYPAFKRIGEFSPTFIHHLSSSEKVVNHEAARLLDGCADELDAEIETSREEATHKLSMRVLYLFAGLTGIIILITFPYSLTLLTSWANNPGASSCPHP